MSDLKRTALYQKHVDLGAKLVPFAGFEMPVRYTTLMDEHMAVRESVGVFDVSHMGEFLVEGPGALALLEKISSNDIGKVSIGQAQYSCMPNDKGGIVDDLITYRLDEDRYLLVVNASNIEKDWNWIKSHNDFGAQMSNLSDDFALLAVQGPKAAELLQPLTKKNLDEIGYYQFTTGSMAGIDDVIISGTGYTGSGGFELYVTSEKAGDLWDAIFDVTLPVKAVAAGLGARDTLRLEMGYCLYGNDIDEDTSPIEAGLGWITKFNHDFVNRDNLESQKTNGVSRRLAGFVLEEKGIPRKGYDIVDEEGNVIGTVTSGTLSPMLDKGIGMGYINVPHHKKGTEIYIQIRKKRIPATVTRPPFVKIEK